MSSSVGLKHGEVRAWKLFSRGILFIYLFILSDQNVLNLDCSNGFTTLDVLKPFE